MFKVPVQIPFAFTFDAAPAIEYLLDRIQPEIVDPDLELAARREEHDRECLGGFCNTCVDLEERCRPQDVPPYPEVAIA